MPVADELDVLIEELDQALDDQSETPAPDSPVTLGESESATHAAEADALDLIAGSKPRRTNVVHLRDSEVVQKFRQDLLEGAVRIEHLNQFLGMVGLIVKKILRKN